MVEMPVCERCKEQKGSMNFADGSKVCRQCIAHEKSALNKCKLCGEGCWRDTPYCWNHNKMFPDKYMDVKE